MIRHRRIQTELARVLSTHDEIGNVTHARNAFFVAVHKRAKRARRSRLWHADEYERVDELCSERVSERLQERFGYKTAIAVRDNSHLTGRRCGCEFTQCAFDIWCRGGLA